ncbi:MAG: FAD-binding protein [Hyphomicrobiaceae bacterium]|nr:FAD-binding protein [Hyphomicrobiaceae bacterium]
MIAEQSEPAALAVVVDGLRERFGERVSTSGAVREQHANTLTWIASEPPDAVVFVENTGDVVEAVKICAENKVPIIPFGAGTSLEGHLNAPYGGVSLDFSRMNRILDVHREDLDCVVEAGVTRKQLNEHLRDTGLFFPVDPGADATLGGMAATRASGTNAVRYGTMRDAVLNLTAVMADGSVVKTAQRARKSSAGYDLTHLLVGSEGTLGVITELTLRLHGVPEAILSAVCPFDTIDGACDAVITAIQMGLGLARCELLDEVQIEACNVHSDLGLKKTPTLFLEFHGTATSTREEVETFSEIASETGGGAFQWAERAEDRNRLWEARHEAYWAARTYRPGADAIATDVCVPISRLAECVRETKKDIDAFKLVAPIVGHIGDGNFHVIPLIDMDSANEVEAAATFLDRLVERALAMEGTCTGEHGVGSGKMKYMQAEHSSGIEVMRAIKRTLDPHNIFNPGKVVELT